MKRFSLTAATLLTLGTPAILAEGGNFLYDQAQQKYASGSYGEALTLFEKAGATMPENADVQFYYGRCALELKRYDEALAAFERALIFDPAHLRARLELARLYAETGRYEHALLETDTLMDTGLSTEARTRMTAFRSSIERKIRRNPFSGTVAIGGGYDSNAYNDIGDRTYTLPLLPWSTISGQKETDTTFFYALATLRHAIDIGEKGGWSFQNSVSGYTKRFTEAETNDLNYFALQLKPVWEEGRYRLEFPIAYERVYLHNDSYLYNLRATAKATYRIDSVSEFAGGYTFRRGFYTDENLDAATHHLFATYQRAFGTDPILLRLNAGYVANREARTARVDVDNRIYQYGISLAKTLPYNMAVSVNYLGESIRYSDTDFFYGTKRRDNRHTFEASLSYPLQKELWLNVKGGYVDNRSDYTPYDYDKTTAMVSLIYSF